MRRRPSDLFGRRIAKQFHGRWFRGTVSSFDFDAGFEVKYDDGDEEHMQCSEVLKSARLFGIRFASETARVQVR